MNQYTAWHATITLYNPLTLLQLLEKMTLVQTEYLYPLAAVYCRGLNFLHAPSRINIQPTMVQRFNTKFDFSESIGVTRQHKTFLDYVVQEAHSLYFSECTEE